MKQVETRNRQETDKWKQAKIKHPRNVNYEGVRNFRLTSGYAPGLIVPSSVTISPG